MKKSCLLLWLALLVTACGPVTPAPTPTQAISPTFTAVSTPLNGAQKYLSDALDIIEANALNSSKVDWEQVRADAFAAEKNAKTPADTYNTIRDVLKQLKDNHSFFMTPEEAKQMNNSTTADYPAPKEKILENRIGYVAVFQFSGQTQEEMNKYADEIQNIIMEQDKKSVCGWVVDLSENLGGNMYPMVAGLGALIGEGELGSFKDAKGQITTWSYRDGQSWYGTEAAAKVSHPEFLLDPEKTPVAVLIGPNTASSGEATALSFRGRANTRFFGHASYGLTTGNAPFELSDGATIILTGVIELDRTGKEYGASISPDFFTSNAEADATNWLLAQPACKK